MIDDDEARFTPSLLAAWRDAAEARARAEQGVQAGIRAEGIRSLVTYRQELEGDRERLRQSLHDFLRDVGATVAWGKHYELVRMVLYELALNAVEHGGAAAIEIEADGGLVTMRAPGVPFGLEELRIGGKGGHRALGDLEASASGTFTVLSRRVGSENEWSVVDEVVSRGYSNPCGISLEGRPSPEDVRSELRRLQACPEIHLYPGPLWSYSDWFRVLDDLRRELGGRSLVVHGVREQGMVAGLIQELLPDVRVAD